MSSALHATTNPWTKLFFNFVKKNIAFPKGWRFIQREIMDPLLPFLLLTPKRFSIKLSRTIITAVAVAKWKINHDKWGLIWLNIRIEWSIVLRICKSQWVYSEKIISKILVNRSKFAVGWPVVGVGDEDVRSNTRPSNIVVNSKQRKSSN